MSSKLITRAQVQLVQELIQLQLAEAASLASANSSTNTTQARRYAAQYTTIRILEVLGLTAETEQ